MPPPVGGGGTQGRGVDTGPVEARTGPYKMGLSLLGLRRLSIKDIFSFMISSM
jgi:hypothetical protein